MNISRKTAIGGIIGAIVAIGLVVAGVYAFGGLGTSSINSMTTQSISTTNGSSSTSSGTGSSGISTSTSNSGGAGSGSTGVLQISMIDPPHVPANVVDVYINYTGIEVHISNSCNSGWFPVTTKGTVNLTSIVSRSALLSSTTLPSGTYNIVRFSVTSAVVTVNNGGTLSNYTAKVPSGMLQTTITGGVKVQPNTVSSLLVDISPTVTGSHDSYTLVPSATAHAQQTANTGSSTTTQSVTSSCTASVTTGPTGTVFG